VRQTSSGGLRRRLVLEWADINGLKRLCSTRNCGRSPSACRSTGFWERFAVHRHYTLRFGSQTARLVRHRLSGDAVHNPCTGFELRPRSTSQSRGTTSQAARMNYAKIDARCQEVFPRYERHNSVVDEHNPLTPLEFQRESMVDTADCAVCTLLSSLLNGGEEIITKLPARGNLDPGGGCSQSEALSLTTVQCSYGTLWSERL
jgi:hypothetical protein